MYILKILDSSVGILYGLLYAMKADIFLSQSLRDFPLNTPHSYHCLHLLWEVTLASEVKMHLLLLCSQLNSLYTLGLQLNFHLNIIHIYQNATLG